MNEFLKEAIVNSINSLIHIDDCFSIEISENKALFVQVDDFGDGKEYFIELNSIDESGCYEPCSICNVYSEFGNVNDVIKTIDNYLKFNNIVV